jgi:hypothetical protein
MGAPRFRRSTREVKKRLRFCNAGLFCKELSELAVNAIWFRRGKD